MDGSHRETKHVGANSQCTQREWREHQRGSVSIGRVVVFVHPLLMHEDSLAVKALLCFSLTHLLFCFSGTFHPERLQSKKNTGSARPLLLFGLSLSPQEPCAQHTQAAMLNKMELLYTWAVNTAAWP